MTVDQRFSEIQQALSQTHYALTSQAPAIDRILHFVSCSCRIECRCGAADQRQRHHERKHVLKELCILAYLELSLAIVSTTHKSVRELAELLPRDVYHGSVVAELVPHCDQILRAERL